MHLRSFNASEYQYVTTKSMWSRAMHSKLVTRFTMVINIGQTTHLIDFLDPSSVWWTGYSWCSVDVFMQSRISPLVNVRGITSA
jgi:hypothetical protein